MADRFPLIANSSANQIQELAANDNLDMTSSGIVGLGSMTCTGNVSIAGTLTYEDVTNIDSIGLITARAGIDVTGGITTIKGGAETISVGSTSEYDPTLKKCTLTLDASSGTIFTHAMSAGNIGIISLTNFGATHGTTYTLLTTQTTVGSGVGNTQATLGIGTYMTLVPKGHSGINTSAKIGSALTLTASATAGDVDMFSFFVQAGTSATTVYTIANNNFRFGVVGP